MKYPTQIPAFAQVAVLISAFSCALPTLRSVYAQDAALPPLPPLAAAPASPAPPAPPKPLSGRVSEELQDVVSSQVRKVMAQADQIRAKALRLGEEARNNFDFHFSLGDPWNSDSQRPRILILAKNPANPEEIHEDLAIMTRLLQKTVQRKSGDGPHAIAMGIPLLGKFGSAGPQAMQLEDRGPIFLLRAPFPLASPKSQQPETASKDQPQNSPWEQTKRELYGSRDPSRQGGGAAIVWDLDLGGSKVDYDENRVEQLKNDVIQALKNADNIRSLKAGDSVTVVIEGTADREPRRVRKTVTRSDSNSDSDEDADVFVGNARNEFGGENKNATPARLFVIAKKADINSFASGKLSAAEFTQRIQMWVR